MKKFSNKICGVLLLLLLTAGLAACNGDSDSTANTNGNTNQPTVTQPSDTATTPPTNQPHQPTLTELSATIEAAGEFWNGW